MKRTRVRRRRAALGVTALAVAALVAGQGGGSDPQATRPVARHTYVVRAGDTVWGIAQRLSGRRADPRALVDAIIRANGLRGAIVPGQSLLIP